MTIRGSGRTLLDTFAALIASCGVNAESSGDGYDCRTRTGHLASGTAYAGFRVGHVLEHTCTNRITGYLVSTADSSVAYPNCMS